MIAVGSCAVDGGLPKAAGGVAVEPLVAAINPGLLAAHGVGADTAGQLLVSAGENHDRLTSEAAFATTHPPPTDLRRASTFIEASRSPPPRLHARVAGLEVKGQVRIRPTGDEVPGLDEEGTGR